MQQLCLACSASLLPSSDVYTTKCCQRPICPSCITSIPRLVRYHPCLACQSGTGSIAGAQDLGQDTFTVGDESDESDVEDQSSLTDTGTLRAEVVHEDHTGTVATQTEPSSLDTSAIEGGPPFYNIKPGDSLQGIALRFGVVDRRELCLLNKLPLSTLTTTPHLLHTRSRILIPPSARKKSDSASNGELSEADKAREVRRARERAEKRLQTLTKEIDWRVAKAYVSLADDPEEVERVSLKRKENGQSVGKAGLEVLAIDRYLDDEEWEANERASGRQVRIEGLPSSSKGGGEKQERRWYSWQ